MTTLFWTVLFCLGLNTLLSEGNILWFIRKPFDKLHEFIETKQMLLIDCENNPHFDNSTLEHLRKQIFWLKVKYFLLKPIILCVTCFSSFWGICVFITLNGLNESLIPYLIINSVSAAFLNTFIYKIYAGLDF